VQEHTAHTVTHITVDAAELRWQSEPGAWASVPRATANVGGPGGRSDTDFHFFCGEAL
jgi:hypothetical protein